MGKGIYLDFIILAVAWVAVMAYRMETVPQIFAVSLAQPLRMAFGSAVIGGLGRLLALSQARE